MVSAMDAAIGNVTDALKAHNMWQNGVFVISNDNGGWLGYGGLNYPYRGWKDSFWEGGFRGIGFVHSPLIKQTGVTYKPILHVSDWCVNHTRLNHTRRH